MDVGADVPSVSCELDGLVGVEVSVGSHHECATGRVFDNETRDVGDFLIGHRDEVTIARGEEHRFAARTDVEVDGVAETVGVDGAVVVEWRADGRDRAGVVLLTQVDSGLC